jgi:hypothetical protein
MKPRYRWEAPAVRVLLAWGSLVWRWYYDCASPQEFSGYAVSYAMAHEGLREVMS